MVALTAQADDLRVGPTRSERLGDCVDGSPERARRRAFLLVHLELERCLAGRAAVVRRDLQELSRPERNQ